MRGIAPGPTAVTTAQALGRLPWFAPLPLAGAALASSLAHVFSLARRVPRRAGGCPCRPIVPHPRPGPTRATSSARDRPPTTTTPDDARPRRAGGHPPPPDRSASLRVTHPPDAQGTRRPSDRQGVTTSRQSVIPFLHALASTGGSDLHCKVGSAPRVRVDGRLRKLQVPRPQARGHRAHARGGPARRPRRHVPRTHEADFAYSVSGVGRFRVNAYQARGTYGMVFRRVAVGAQPLAELGLPEVIGELALEPRGLVLVTGPTGSGKTTTLASMVDLINTLPRGQHRHDRGPDRDPAPGQEVDRLPARGPPGHRRLHRRRCAPRCARTPT